MNVEKKKGKLMREFRLTSSDFFIDRKDGRAADLMIIRKTGMIKIQQKLGIQISLISMTVIPYGDKAMALAIVKGGMIGDKLSYITTEGEASPDNCNTAFGFYAATAKKRAESRLTLELADLSKLDMHGEIEAEEFKAAGRGAKSLSSTLSKTQEVYDEAKKP